VAKAARELWKDKGSVDFIVELPESHRYDTIMCVIDSLTKRADTTQAP
jgi:hypothetical protein